MPNIKVNKPWGYEIILTDPDLPYTAKLLHINQAEELSLQYHDQKTETLTLVSGDCQISIGPNQQSINTVKMKPHQGYTLKPNTVHQIKANTNCLIFEASTPEIGTTYRLQDKYGRPDESQQIRNSQRQHE